MRRRLQAAMRESRRSLRRAFRYPQLGLRRAFRYFYETQSLNAYCVAQTSSVGVRRPPSAVTRSVLSGSLGEFAPPPHAGGDVSPRRRHVTGVVAPRPIWTVGGNQFRLQL